MTKREAGWYPDPFRRHQQRYHDGAGWTEHVSDRGQQSTDPAEPSPTGAGASGFRRGATRRFGEGPPAAPAYLPTARRSSRAERGGNIAKTFAALSAVTVIVGSVLPWAEVNTVFLSVSKNGTDGDGVLTLGAAVVVILSLVTAGGLVRAAIVALLGVLIGVVAVVDITDLHERFTDIPASVDADVGIGLWFVLAGAIGIVVAGAMLSQKA